MNRESLAGRGIERDGVPSWHEGEGEESVHNVDNAQEGAGRARESPPISPYCWWALCLPDGIQGCSAGGNALI